MMNYKSVSPKKVDKNAITILNIVFLLYFKQINLKKRSVLMHL